MGRTKGSNTSPSATREWCQRRVRVKGHRTRLNEVDEIVQGWGGSEKEGTRANTCARAMYHHCTANLLERYYYRSTLSYKCHCIVQEFPFAAPAAVFQLSASSSVARGWKVDAAGIIGLRATTNSTCRRSVCSEPQVAPSAPLEYPRHRDAHRPVQGYPAGPSLSEARRHRRRHYIDFVAPR